MSEQQYILFRGSVSEGFEASLIEHKSNKGGVRLTAQEARTAAKRLLYLANEIDPADPDDTQELVSASLSADVVYVGGKPFVSAERLAAAQEENVRLQEALTPFALTENERFELGSFGDEELVYMRPDDGNDSVKNGWRKRVTIGDTRRASEAVRGNAP